MINNTRFKKILHILKQNSDDLNINICIVDYDVLKECDYEVLILHLKETNTQNHTSVYKDFIIRSQVYYDVSEKKYLSALDGDIVVKNGALTHIDILTPITEMKFSDKNINIKAKLLDVDLNEPIKNQPLFLYLSSTPEESITSATTNKDGIASFNFSLQDTTVDIGENLLYVSYKGNNTYRESTSDALLVNIVDEFGDSIKHLTSSLDATLTPTQQLSLRYNVALNHKNLSNGFMDYSTIEATDAELLQGPVYFYINDTLIGEVANLTNDNNTSYAAIELPFNNQYFNQNLTIQAIFSGNNFFPLNVATITTNLTRIAPENPVLTITKRDTDIYDIFLSFQIPKTINESDIIQTNGHDTAFIATSQVDFYLYDRHGILHKDINNMGIARVTDFDIDTSNPDYNIIKIQPKVISLNRAEYDLGENSAFRVKAVYQGNSVIEGFEIENGYFFDFDVFVHKGMSDTPIEDATVELRIVDDEDETQFIVVDTQNTNLDGRCSFANIQLGKYQLCIIKNGYITHTHSLVVNSLIDSCIDIGLTKDNWEHNIILDTSDSFITINVLNSQNQPLSDVDITLYHDENTIMNTGQTDAQGLYIIALDAINFPTINNAISKQLYVVASKNNMTAQSDIINNITTGKMITLLLE